MPEPKEQFYLQLYRNIDRYPGLTATAHAQILDVPLSTVKSAIDNMPTCGLLITEDNRAGLWTFEDQRHDKA
jgi:hypothetical protein